LAAVLAKSYVQVYAVAPGESLTYSTEMIDGESATLTGDIVCYPMLFQRVLSGPGSYPTHEPQIDAADDMCRLLEIADFSDFAGGSTVKVSSRKPVACSWETDTGFWFHIGRGTNNDQGTADYKLTYPAPCDNGTFGYIEGNGIYAACPRDSGRYTFNLSWLNRDPYEATVAEFARLVRKAMSQVH
jgi:hypothetical protein